MSAQYAFGTGLVFAKATGNSAANPINFGTLQDVSLDFSWTTKELFGQYAIAVAVGRGTGKLTGKASIASFNAQIFNDLFLGLTTPATVGAARVSAYEPQQIVTKNINVNHNTNFVRDLGVTYAANGGILLFVTGNNPTGDQYTCNTANGNYQFNASLNNANVLVSYEYQPGSSGLTIPWANTLIGAAPEFLLVFNTQFNGQAATLIFNSVISTKLSIATKIEDFTIPAFDFQIKADSGNNIGSLNFDQ